MKKWLVLALTCLMVFGLATVSMAGTVYLDIWSGGEFDDGFSSYDLSQFSIGLDLPIKQFKFGCNLSSGTIKDVNDDDLDTTSIFMKGGYALINDHKLRLDVTAGYFDRRIFRDYTTNDENGRIKSDSFYSLVIGFDAKLAINKKIWFDFNYNLGIDPTFKRFYANGYGKADIDSISVLNCKCNYLFTDNIGAALGYCSEQIEVSASNKLTFSGLTIGAFYKF